MFSPSESEDKGKTQSRVSVCKRKNKEELMQSFTDLTHQKDSLVKPLSQNFPSITPTPLENLKTLTMKCVDLYVPDDMLFTLYLMRTAPNLRNLTIHLESITVELYAQSKKLQGVAAELLKYEATKDTSCSSLQTINIKGIEGLQHEILLIDLLKKKCQKLNIETKMPRFRRSHQVINH